MKSCPKTSLSSLSFSEKDAVVGISLLFVRSRKRHVTAASTQHSSLSAFARFSDAFLCNRTVRALLHPLSVSTQQGLLVERLPHLYNAVCAYQPNLAGIRFRRAELFFCWIEALSAHSCHSGYGT